METLAARQIRITALIDATTNEEQLIRVLKTELRQTLVDFQTLTAGQSGAWDVSGLLEAIGG